MRVKQTTLAVVLALSMPFAASAQGGGDQGGQTGTQGGGTTTGGTQGGTGTTSGGQTTGGNGWFAGPGESHWIVSASIGSMYGSNADELGTGTGTDTPILGTSTSADASLDIGATVGYLWRNIAGAEFVAAFTPNFQMENTAVAGDITPNINSYMINAVGAIPLGLDGRWQPFVSGGFGAIQINGDDLTVTDPNGNVSGTAVTSFFEPDDTRGGGNIGAGLLAFVGNWGVRGDIRYFRAFDTDDEVTTTGTTTTEDESGVLPGLSFWRANIGLAYRW